MGTSLGVSIVDVTTNPFQPEQVGFIPGDESNWRDVKFYNNHMYISTEADMGIQVADITDPENPELVFEWDGVIRAHNLFQADGYLYVVGADEGDDIEILDLSNPAEPVRVGGWSAEYIHDVYVRDNYAYACGYYSSTMYIIDISDPANPFTEASWTYPGAAHATWLTEDGNYLITGDETSGGYVKIWDISDFNNINMVSEWLPEGGENKSAHNVFVRGDYLYISYYVFGLQILDISDPTNPELAGYYDTYPGEEGLYEGNWGVYPFAESCHSYVSDMEAGLVLVDFDGCVNPDPELSFSPESFNFQTTQGEIVTDILTLTNTGDEGSTLYFRVEAEGTSPFENPGGGPDIFGYEWSDSDLDSDISFDWINIEGHFSTEEVLFSTNDDAPEPFQLVSEFPFYGNSYSHLIVNPNGWVGFGSDSDSWDNLNIPNSHAPTSAIFALWDDLNPENMNCNEFCSGKVYINSNEYRSVIWFNDVAKWYSEGDEAFFDFQIVLYSSGKIKINYNSIIGVPSATIGIQNQDGNDGLLVSFLTEYLHDFLSLEFESGGVPNWITINNGQNEGQINSGETDDIIIQIDTGSLEPGIFEIDLKILNNASPSISIPLELIVEDTDANMTLTIPNSIDWNLIGLPLNLSNVNYQNVFPTGIEGSCYGFDGEYFQVIDMELGKGNWLRFPDIGSTDITGELVEDLTVDILQGWNIISGISQVVTEEQIIDLQGILIPGTLYGFDETYIDSPILEPGKGYWIRASGSGEIVVSSTGSLTSRMTILKPKYPNTLTFKNQFFYFGNEIEVDNPLSFSLPPKPPLGTKDIRFSGDTKLCSTDECVIEVMNGGRPLSFECEIKDGEVWEIVDESGTVFECEGVQVIEMSAETEILLLRTSTSAQAPQKFALSPAYPNPFNPVTTIQFTLSMVETLDRTSLQIYDINGKQIETLLDKQLPPGTHTIKWNASGFSSGAYILKFKSGSFSEIQKLMFIK